MKNLNEQIKRINQLNKQLTPSRGFTEPTDNTYQKLKIPTLRAPKIEPKKIEKKDLPFDKITSLTIDHIEGGYYPGTGGKDMGKSGETMFGMDRKHGVSFTQSPDGQLFWKLIDNDKRKNPKKWVRYYKLDDNTELKDKLLNIVTKQFLIPKYGDLSDRYLKPEVKEIVNYDPRLKFHMSYGVWNGSGWFKKFAEDLNKKFESGGKTPDILADTALQSRIKSGNTHIKKSGIKIKDEILPQLA
jgi:hypothetical protein